MRLTHHDLCFGCGLANIFGLQLELERRDDGSVEGRFFVKQDHQGPPGFAHGGVLAAALDEAAALCAGDETTPAITARMEVDFRAGAPIGAFVGLEARVQRREGRKLWVGVRAFSEAGDESSSELASATVLLVSGGDA